MLKAMQLARAWRTPSAMAHGLVGIWNRDFHDVRLILEQQGELQYFSITRGCQRWIARGLIVASGSALVALLALAVFSMHLHVERSRLEDSHRQIFQALLGSTEASGAADPVLDESEMLMLAQSIRDRDLEIRRYVEGATTDLAKQNDELHKKLNTSGLTEKAIKVIHGSSPMGGFTRGRDEEIAPLLRKEFAEQSAANRELRDVLSALPSSMPVQDHVITSRFGIRNHPISGRPKFHAGIDLISKGDDNIYPARAGKVILARPYNDYGLTVIVNHGRGVETLYAHMASINVKEGQDVDLSTVLGQIGNTGASTGKHLHFEVSVGSYPVDPIKVIDTAQYVQQAKIQP
jgi:murein DD-endopeptidase MepM/ murein hydrolase activator NlpD